MTQPTWPTYFMGFAAHAAVKSKDATQVGAVLIGEDGEVRLTGYNGPPIRVVDLPERRERPIKYLFVSHAEANIIAFAAREGIRTKGCTIYVTHASCCDCMKAMIQAGVSRIVYGPGLTSMPPEMFEAAKTMAREAGVKYEAFEE
jgi:dCMP deaminase